MAVPYTFGTATAAIPLSQLDSNFSTTITLGNTAIQLGNTVTTLNNMTLANVTVSSGNVTLTNVTVTTANVTTANITTAAITTGNVTTGNVTTLAVGSGGIKSAGNVVVGTVDFTNTAVTGAMAVNGYGIYPYVSQGTTNSTIFSGFNWYTPTAWSGNNGASSQTFYPVNVIANVKNDGSGGTNRTAIFALNLSANVDSSGVASQTRSQAFLITSSRYSATDLSTRTDNQVFGGSITATHATTAPGTIVSSTLQGLGTTASNFSGTATLQIGMGSNIRVGDTSGSPTTVSTTAYNIYSSTFGVGTASGNTATVTTGASFYAVGPTVGTTGTMTTYYGLFLGAASISGTLTNNWGVYSADTAATNYFGGNVGVGTTSPNASAILDAQSTTKGVRMPNMTTTQKNAISSPAAGLMVFDTTLSKLCVYSGAAWQTITSV
jgi:hypothetical protein